MESDEWQEERAAAKRLLVSAPRTATEQREKHRGREMKGFDSIPAPGIPAGATITGNTASTRMIGSKISYSSQQIFSNTQSEMPSYCWSNFYDCLSDTILRAAGHSDPFLFLERYYSRKMLQLTCSGAVFVFFKNNAGQPAIIASMLRLVSLF